MAFNKAIIEGRLCTDPELRTGQTGVNVCKFRVAVDRQKKDKVDYFGCTAFGKTAEFVAQWFKKGKPILIEGRVETDEYIDKEGNRRSITGINVEKATFTVSDKGETQPAAQQTLDNDDGDLPF